MFESIFSVRDILQTLGQSLTRPLPDFLEFVVMDAFLVVLLLYIGLFIWKIFKLLQWMVTAPFKRKPVTADAAEGIIDERSKAERAKQLLKDQKRRINPFKSVGGFFGKAFRSIGGGCKWFFSLPVKLLGVLKRKKQDEPVVTQEVSADISGFTTDTPDTILDELNGEEDAPDAIPAVENVIAANDGAEVTTTEVDPVDVSVPPEVPPAAASEMPEVLTGQHPIPPAAPLPIPTPPPTNMSEEALTAAFEQELRDAQQAEGQLGQLKAKAAETALQKGAMAAHRSVEEALPWYEKAAELDPKSAAAQLGLSRLYKETGNLLGAFDAAQKAFTSTGDAQTQTLALEGMEQVIIAKSDAPSLPGPQEPVQPDEKTIESIQFALRSDPENPELQRDLSIAYDEIGDGLAEQDNLVGALESFESSLMVIERLTNSYPDEVVYQRDLSICHEKIGEIQ
ncbi:MAG: hypothetical protein CMM52_06445 [Rhodospirillaceae bacterium]|nr:hypothetical protein [Rhodospirillaceae bacterium]|tara:strand:+ start:8284 stop:9642 length:1359 start_codon:yes stop_codon:yes gene_type:complete